MAHLRQFLKALGGAAVAFGTGLTTAASDGTVTSGEWWTILGGTVAALGIVYAIPNAAPKE